jgi:uncharacterized membrane protein YhhN
LILIILIFTLLGGWIQTGFWFGAGLVFSLFGDIFLLLRSRFFIAGLFSFLIAHLLYIIGFNQGFLKLNLWGLIPLFLVIGLVFLAYPRIIGGVRRRLENRRLWLPVVLYMLTITIMILSAMMTWFRDQWTLESALLASVGALLFTISDTLLATGRFLRPVPYGNFLVMFTYHMGQLGIATGALMMLGLL